SRGATALPGRPERLAGGVRGGRSPLRLKNLGGPSRGPPCSPSQPAQRREVLQVGGRVGLLRRLEYLRHARKAWIVEQQAERTQAEPAAPDVLVAVEAGAEPGAGAVQVEREHARQS